MDEDDADDAFQSIDEAVYLSGQYYGMGTGQLELTEEMLQSFGVDTDLVDIGSTSFDIFFWQQANGNLLLRIARENSDTSVMQNVLVEATADSTFVYVYFGASLQRCERRFSSIFNTSSSVPESPVLDLANGQLGDITFDPSAVMEGRPWNASNVELPDRGACRAIDVEFAMHVTSNSTFSYSTRRLEGGKTSFNAKLASAQHFHGDQGARNYRKLITEDPNLEHLEAQHEQQGFRHSLREYADLLATAEEIHEKQRRRLIDQKAAIDFLQTEEGYVFVENTRFLLPAEYPCTVIILGSNDFDDWWQNIAGTFSVTTFQSMITGQNIDVQGGFFEHANTIFEYLVDNGSLDGCSMPEFAGHSLGGAAAEVLSHMFGGKAMSFGAPAVYYSPSAIPPCPSYRARYLHGDDPVPTTPPNFEHNLLAVRYEDDLFGYWGWVSCEWWSCYRYTDVPGVENTDCRDWGFARAELLLCFPEGGLCTTREAKRSNFPFWDAAGHSSQEADTPPAGTAERAAAASRDPLRFLRQAASPHRKIPCIQHHAKTLVTPSSATPPPLCAVCGALHIAAESRVHARDRRTEPAPNRDRRNPRLAEEMETRTVFSLASQPLNLRMRLTIASFATGCAGICPLPRLLFARDPVEV
eukprot:scaffold733_cov267-Pinguiococcus_pyrenoidosus.AAC.35